MITETLIALGKVVGIALVRGIAGWLENATRDKQITKIELSELASTVIRITILSTGLYFGIDPFFEDYSVVAAGTSAVVFDFLLRSIKKLSDKNKEEKTEVGS